MQLDKESEKTPEPSRSSEDRTESPTPAAVASCSSGSCSAPGPGHGSSFGPGAAKGGKPKLACQCNRTVSDSSAAPPCYCSSPVPFAPTSGQGALSPPSGKLAAASSSRSNCAAFDAPKHEHVTGISEAALGHFRDALALVDPRERDGWEKARERCPPTVLDHEACPCYFLAACRSNPWDAAARYCSYWNERIDLFQDKAFEALTIGTEDDPPTGLTKDDVDVLETGCTQLLPPDRQGRSVIFLDRARLRPHMHHATLGRLRTLWYIMQKAYTQATLSSSSTTSSASASVVLSSAAPFSSTSVGGGPPTDRVTDAPGGQAHRIVVLALCSRPPKSGYDWQFAARAVRLPQSMPIQAEAVHLLTLPASSGTGRVLQAVIASSIGMLGTFFAGLAKVHHGARIDENVGGLAANERDGMRANELDDDFDNNGGGSSSSSSWNLSDLDPRERLLHRLRQYGLSKRGLPTCAGGPVSDATFHNWLKRQRRWEQAVHWSPAQRAQRKRDVNRVHSRQKRQRRRQEFQHLQDQVHELERANAEARQLHFRLESLLKQAKFVAQTCLERPDGLPPAQAVSATPFQPQSMPVPIAPPPSAPPTTAFPDRHDAAASPADYGLIDDSFTSLLAALEPDPIAPSCIPGSSGTGLQIQTLTSAPHRQRHANQAPEPPQALSQGLELMGGGALVPAPTVLAAPWCNGGNNSFFLGEMLQQPVIPIASASFYPVSCHGILPPGDASTPSSREVTAAPSAGEAFPALQRLSVPQLHLLLQEQSHPEPTPVAEVSSDRDPSPWHQPSHARGGLGSLTSTNFLQTSAPLAGSAISLSSTSSSNVVSTPYIEKCLAAEMQQHLLANDISQPVLSLHQALDGIALTHRDHRILGSGAVTWNPPHTSEPTPDGWEPGHGSHPSQSLGGPENRLVVDEDLGLGEAPLDPLLCWDHFA